jgi:hypothetical protein
VKAITTGRRFSGRLAANRPQGRAATRGFKSNETLTARPDFRDLDSQPKSPDPLPLTEKAAVTQQRSSSSDPAARLITTALLGIVVVRGR